MSSVDVLKVIDKAAARGDDDLLYDTHELVAQLIQAVVDYGDFNNHSSYNHMMDCVMRCKGGVV